MFFYKFYFSFVCTTFIKRKSIKKTKEYCTQSAQISRADATFTFFSFSLALSLSLNYICIFNFFSVSLMVRWKSTRLCLCEPWIIGMCC